MYLNYVMIFSVFIAVDTYPFITTDSVLPNEDHESPVQVWIVVEQDLKRLNKSVMASTAMCVLEGLSTIILRFSMVFPLNEVKKWLYSF